jgi:hypothetical protein
MSAQIPRARRAPQFVSRRTAMALLDLSSTGFNSLGKAAMLAVTAAVTEAVTVAATSVSAEPGAIATTLPIDSVRVELQATRCCRRPAQARRPTSRVGAGPRSRRECTAIDPAHRGTYLARRSRSGRSANGLGGIETLSHPGRGPVSLVHTQKAGIKYKKPTWILLHQLMVGVGQSLATSRPRTGLTVIRRFFSSRLMILARTAGKSSKSISAARQKMSLFQSVARPLKGDEKRQMVYPPDYFSALCHSLSRFMSAAPRKRTWLPSQFDFSAPLWKFEHKARRRRMRKQPTLCIGDARLGGSDAAADVEHATLGADHAARLAHAAHE